MRVQEAAPTHVACRVLSPDAITLARFCHRMTLKQLTPNLLGVVEAGSVGMDGKTLIP